MRLILVTSLLAATGLAVACGGGGSSSPNGSVQETTSNAVTREALTELLMEKTTDEVLKAVGKPNTTSESAGRKYWYYTTGLSYDSVTGKVDRNIQVCFGEDGRVQSVNY